MLNGLVEGIVVIAIGVLMWFLAPYARANPLILIIKVVGAVVVLVGVIIIVSGLLGLGGIS